MQNIIITVLIIFNIFSIFILFKMTKGEELTKRIIITIVLTILNFIILNIIYGIASIGINNDVTSISKMMLIFAFMPINLVAMASPMAIAVNEEKPEIKRNKIIRNVIIAIILLILEIIALKNIQIGIQNMQNKNKNILENNMIIENSSNILNNDISNSITKTIQ